MANVVKIQEFGNQLAVIFDDGSRKLAYPSMGGMWYLKDPGAPIPDDPTDPPVPSTGGLIDWWTGPYGGITGTWEDHASYSRGGTDWGLPMDTPIKAPAPGTLVNYGNIDAAGLKSILVLDAQHERQIAASSTLMNGVYRETEGGNWAYGFCIQHLNSQVPAGHYNQGDVIGYSGNSAGPGSTGDTHLHAHLLAYPANVGAPRLDFMKFIN